MATSKSLVDTLLSDSSVNVLGEASGAKKEQVQQVLANALPTLIQNMKKNVSTKSGEEALSKALSDHARTDTNNIASFLKNVDLEDGGKILSHILGQDKGTLETSSAKKSGLTANQTSTILSAAAPLLLSLLGKKKKDDDESEGGSGGLLGVLSSVLLGNKKDDEDSDGGLGGALATGLGSLLGGKDDGKKDEDNGLGGILLGGLGSLLGGEEDKKKKKKKKTSTSKKPTAKKTGTKKKAASKKTSKKK